MKEIIKKNEIMKEAIQSAYVILTQLVMLVWAAGLLILLTKLIVIYYPEMPLIFMIGWLLGCLNILALVIMKNWSFINFPKIGSK